MSNALRIALICFLFSFSAISLSAQLTVNPDGSTTFSNGAKTATAPVTSTDLTSKAYVDSGTLERGTVTIAPTGIVTGGKIYWEKYSNGKVRQFGWITVDPADGANSAGTFPTLAWPVAPISDEGLDISANYMGRRTDSTNLTGPTDTVFTIGVFVGTVVRFNDPGTGNRRDGFTLIALKGDGANWSSTERLIFAVRMEGNWK